MLLVLRFPPSHLRVPTVRCRRRRSWMCCELRMGWEQQSGPLVAHGPSLSTHLNVATVDRQVGYVALDVVDDDERAPTYSQHESAS